MTTAFTPHAKNHQGLGPLASRLVQANELEWEPIRYPGCYVKTLMVDPKNGHLTVLLKMDPGARLPDHEHTLVEQTFVIEGQVVRYAGAAVTPAGTGLANRLYVRVRGRVTTDGALVNVTANVAVLINHAGLKLRSIEHDTRQNRYVAAARAIISLQPVPDQQLGRPYEARDRVAVRIT